MNFSLGNFAHQYAPDIAVTAVIAGDLLKLTYAVNPSWASAKALVWPAYTELNRAMDLWHSTCFELFVGPAESTTYLELNLSPSGAWNCFSFDDVRLGMKTSDALSVILMQPEAHILNVELDVSALNDYDSVHLGLSAVLAYASDHNDYYALSHGNKPDFHHPQHHRMIKLDDMRQVPQHPVRVG